MPSKPGITAECAVQTRRVQNRPLHPAHFAHEGFEEGRSGTDRAGGSQRVNGGDVEMADGYGRRQKTTPPPLALQPFAVTARGFAALIGREASCGWAAKKLG